MDLGFQPGLFDTKVGYLNYYSRFDRWSPEEHNELTKGTQSIRGRAEPWTQVSWLPAMESSCLKSNSSTPTHARSSLGMGAWGRVPRVKV